jgi:hypothetical protein
LNSKGKKACKVWIRYWIDADHICADWHLSHLGSIYQRRYPPKAHLYFQGMMLLLLCASRSQNQTFPL